MSADYLQQDVTKYLKSKGYTSRVVIENISTVGCVKTCSINIADGWLFEGVAWMVLDESGNWKYQPMHVAEIALEKLERYLKYGNK